MKKTDLLKVIFVDDELDLLKLFELRFSKELADLPIVAVTTGSAKQCISLVEQLDPAESVLIITDINMPEVTGLQLLSTLKNSHPHVKVYICTAFDRPELRVEAARLRADHFFVKPLNFQELRTVILTDFIRIFDAV